MAEVEKIRSGGRGLTLLSLSDALRIKPDSRDYADENEDVGDAHVNAGGHRYITCAQSPSITGSCRLSL